MPETYIFVFHIIRLIHVLVKINMLLFNRHPGSGYFFRHIISVEYSCEKYGFTWEQTCKRGVKTFSFPTSMSPQCNLGSTAFLPHFGTWFLHTVCPSEALCGTCMCTAEMSVSITRVISLVAPLWLSKQQIKWLYCFEDVEWTEFFNFPMLSHTGTSPCYL